MSKRALSPAQLAHNRAIAVSGGKARARMPDFMEHQRRNARITISRHGLAKLIELATAKRLAKPSCHEQRFMDWLAAEGVTGYTREQPPCEGSLYRMDFAWLATRKVIDVDGEVHDLFGTEPKTQQREAARIACILDNGWGYMRIHWTHIGRPDILARIKEHIDALPDDDPMADIPF